MPRVRHVAPLVLAAMVAAGGSSFSLAAQSTPAPGAGAGQAPTAQNPPPPAPKPPGDLPTAATQSAANQPATDQPAVDPGIGSVTLNLATRSFDKVLPFDVPFHLTGPAPPAVQEITLWYIGSKDRIPLTVATTTTGQCTATRTHADTRNAESDDWLPAGSWRRSAVFDQQAAATFVLAVPPLQAMRYYVFGLDIQTNLAPDKLDGYRAQAKALFDTRLDQQGRQRGLSAADVESLRDGLVVDLRNALGAGTIIAKNSYFDPCLKLADNVDLRVRFINDINPLLEAQDNVESVLGNLAENQAALKTLLDGINANPALQPALQHLDSVAKTGGTAGGAETLTDLFLKRDSGMDYATALMAPSVESAILGPVPPAAGSGIAAAAAYSATIGQTYTDALARLDSLDRWLDAIVTPGSFSVIPPGIGTLSAAQVSGIRDLKDRGALKTARDLLRARLVPLVADLKARLAARTSALDALAQKVAVTARDEVRVDATTTGNADTFQHYFITADIGLLYGLQVSKLVPYGGVNLYLRPINSDVPLSQIQLLHRNTFLYRFSFTLGYTLQSIADANDATRKDLFGGGSLVVGAGLRLTDTLRLSAGALLFTKENPNPLITSTAVGAAPYLSISFDWKVAKTFNVIGQKLFSN